MQTLRRFDVRNATYFVTVVTYKRQPLLLEHADLFRKCWDAVRPFAWVLMPDHLHVMITVKDRSISAVMHSFKTSLVRGWHRRGGSGRFWQNRFWDHVIRDCDDMMRHLDYIHYNPVKHGLASDPFLYGYSSLGKWFERGYYQRDWGRSEPESQEGEYGE